MMQEFDPKILEEMQKGERLCDKPGLILLVESDKLRGITPYAVRETGSLLYLEALTVITEKKGRRYEIPQLGMLKHIS